MKSLETEVSLTLSSDKEWRCVRSSVLMAASSVLGPRPFKHHVWISETVLVAAIAKKKRGYYLVFKERLARAKAQAEWVRLWDVVNSLCKKDKESPLVDQAASSEQAATGYDLYTLYSTLVVFAEDCGTSFSSNDLGWQRQPESAGSVVSVERSIQNTP
ncbi:unnamed protein product [Caretta caretta]